MLTYDQIKELIQIVSERQLHGLEIERSGFRLKITGAAQEAQPMEVRASPAPFVVVTPGAPSQALHAPDAPSTAHTTTASNRPQARPRARPALASGLCTFTMLAAKDAKRPRGVGNRVPGPARGR